MAPLPRLDGIPASDPFACRCTRARGAVSFCLQVSARPARSPGCRPAQWLQAGRIGGRRLACLLDFYKNRNLKIVLLEGCL